MNVRIISTASIFLTYKKVLVVVSIFRENSFFLFPGGSIEREESIKETVRREVKEETNLDVEVKDILFAREWINPEKSGNVLDLFFECTLLSENITSKND